MISLEDLVVLWNFYLVPFFEYVLQIVKMSWFVYGINLSLEYFNP